MGMLGVALCRMRLIGAMLTIVRLATTCRIIVCLASGRAYMLMTPRELLPVMRLTTMTICPVLRMRLTVLFTFPITPFGTT